jgi:hypothetical protein
MKKRIMKLNIKIKQAQRKTKFKEELDNFFGKVDQGLKQNSAHVASEVVLDAHMIDKELEDVELPKREVVHIDLKVD